MNNYQDPIRIDALQTAESAYRNQLASDPCDTQARVKLAWCLFVQAVHAAGRESLFHEVHEGSVRVDERLPRVIEAIRENDVDHLLRDCLRQTTAVIHLSKEQRDRTDVEMLQTLIGMAGAERWTYDTSREADRCLYNIARAIIQDGTDVRPRRSMRRLSLARPDRARGE